MEEIRLLSPSADYAEDIMKFKQEILLASDDDAFAGCGKLLLKMYMGLRCRGSHL